MSEKIKEEKVRKVFLDDLPRWENGTNKGKVNWNLSIGYKVKFIYNDIEGWLEILKHEIIIQSKRKRNFLTIKYNNIVKTINADKLLEGKIGNIIGTKTTEFKIKIGTTLKDNNRDITITDKEYKVNNKSNGYIQNEKWYKYTCNKCGWTEGWIVEGNLNKGKGCGCCCATPRTIVLGINTIWDTDRWMCDLGVSEEDAKTHTYGSGDKVKVTCPNCEMVRKVIISDIYRNKTISCNCNDGKPYSEKAMFNILEQLKINFIPQLNKSNFEWCDKYSYDFYLNDYNIAIETHGIQHYKDSSGVFVKTLEETQKNDEYKKQLAITNGIKEENYIVLDCRWSGLEWIKNSILNSNIAKVFDLSIINWSEVETFALSNRVKEACNLWSLKIYSIKDISNIMKLCKNTVVSYLKKGSQLELSWCDYNPREETKKGIGKLNKMGNNVICLENLLVFETAHEYDRQSENIFGIKLGYSCISRSCRLNKPYKGFHFKYIKDLSKEERILYKLE